MNKAHWAHPIEIEILKIAFVAVLEPHFTTCPLEDNQSRISYQLPYCTAWNTCLIGGRGNPRFRQGIDSTLFLCRIEKENMNN